MAYLDREPVDFTGLDMLREHNDQLAQMLTPDGLKEIERMVVLETALHAHIDKTIDDLLELPEAGWGEKLKEFLIHPGYDDDVIAAEIILPGMTSYLSIPGPIKDVGKKVGSVANNYLKKKAEGVIGGGGDE